MKTELTFFLGPIVYGNGIGVLVLLIGSVSAFQRIFFSGFDFSPLLTFAVWGKNWATMKIVSRISVRKNPQTERCSIFEFELLKDRRVEIRAYQNRQRPCLGVNYVALKCGPVSDFAYMPRGFYFHLKKSVLQTSLFKASLCSLSKLDWGENWRIWGIQAPF